MNHEIKEELEKIAATLAPIGNRNCYRVPDDYFEDFATEVMSKIQLPATEMPYAAPAPAYFEGLAGSILHKIKNGAAAAERESEAVLELKELSPLLASIKKENVYTLPAQYFANFKVTIPAAQHATITLMQQPVRWIRYAAAAAVIGIIATGSYFFFKPGNEANNNNGTLASNYNKVSLSSVSNDAIANYLSETAIGMEMIPSAFDDARINAGSLAEELLNEISETDIQKYLQENQQPGENDTKGI